MSTTHAPVRQEMADHGRADDVSDHAEALTLALEHGSVGETYNIGARCEQTNLDADRPRLAKTPWYYGAISTHFIAVRLSS